MSDTEDVRLIPTKVTNSPPPGHRRRSTDGRRYSWRSGHSAKSSASFLELSYGQGKAGKGSTPSAFFNFFKSMFGAGVLALPHAMTWSGLTSGIVGYSIVAFVCWFSIYLLIKSIQEARIHSHVTAEEEGDEPLELKTYTELSGYVLGDWGYYFCLAMVLLIETCFCIGFVIVASHNIVAVIESYHGPSLFTKSSVAGMLFPIVAPLACIKYVKDLWVISFIGLVVYIFGVMGIVYYHVAFDNGPPHNHKQFDLFGVPKFLGVAMYGLEGILMVIPVEASMEKPHHAQKAIGGGMFCYSMLTVLFGAVGMAFGYGDCGGGGIITDCLPEGPSTTALRLCLAGTLVISIPLMLFPVSDTLQEWLLTTDEDNEEPSRFRQNCMRIAEAAVVCAIAAAFTDFSLFSDLIGSLLNTLAGFVLPALIYIKVGKMTGKGRSLPMTIAAYFTLVFGVAVGAAGTVSAVKAIVDAL